MTPLPSSIPVVKAALVDTLSARPALSGLVTYGVPRELPAKEWVAVTNVEGSQRAISVGRGGASRRGEDFRILVVVTVTGSAFDDPRTTTERAFALVAEIDDALRDDPELGLTSSQALVVAEVVKTDLSESIGDGTSRQSVVTVFVQCTTRI